MIIIIISLRKYIPKNIKQIFGKVWRAQVARTRLKKFIKKGTKPKIYLIGTPRHGNLGDQAIAHAEIKFLVDNCRNYDVFEIQFEELDYYFERLKRLVEADDILMLHGGGNMGVEYLREEELRRKVITNFKKQKITSFPQTIYFGKSDAGRKELEKTKKVYNSHSNLTIIAREKVSFDKMKDVFNNNNVILTPDIVMYLNENKLSKERKNILFCFRNDNEKVVSSEFRKKLYKQLSAQENIIITDTVVNYSFNKDKREDELNKIWSTFRQSKLVITDRLHGMVFAAITSTPCIAFSNYNQKVKGTYEWLKHLPYIKFIEDENDVYKYVDELLSLDKNEYDNNFAMIYYEQIVKIINND